MGRRVTGARAGVVLLCGIALVALIAVATMSRSAPRAAGTSDVVVQTEVARLAPGARACQPHELIAAPTRALSVNGWLEGPNAEISATVGGVQGAAVAVSAGQPIVLPVAGGKDRSVDACIANRGPATLVLAGAQTGPADQLVIAQAGQPDANASGRVRLDQLASARPATLWSVVGDLPQRDSSATGVDAAPWLVAGGLLAALVAAVALLWRREDDVHG
ncbi:MAG TPA: hypothetical protein VGM91_08880 [Conexibacter sp.]|jgi:hypothetical protein